MSWLALVKLWNTLIAPWPELVDGDEFSLWDAGRPVDRTALVSYPCATLVVCQM